ncbi:MAG: flagellar biosynthesis regulator FlaF [Magnetospirillum sp.]|nr:flagellar biosynthesis regulator FlaF [Magnetospirillum sp.]
MTEQLSVAEEQAFQLSQAAILLDQARQDTSDQGKLAHALENNLEVWVAINTIAKSADCMLPAAAKDNLRRLAEFVADRTLKGAGEVPSNTLDTLININLQISEGLLEGAKA